MKFKSKIGILNFQYSKHNYGAVLQAAALEFTLKELGHNVIHIDFEPKAKKTLRSIIGKLLRSLKIVKSNSLKVNNSEAFENFRNNFISRTNKINSSKAFYNLAKEFDAIIVGSDQVWRPRMSSDLMAFFLSYVPESVTRISYAASFGVADWELANGSNITKKARRELKKFKAISCRELSGVQICKNTFGVDSVHVLDPLLLVDFSFYQQLMNKEIKDNSPIVYYKLDNNDLFVAVIKKLYDEKPRNIYFKNSINLEYEEVTTWLNYLYNSNTIITDSFHCICLGLIFSKEVIYSPNPKRGQARLDSLFSMLKISTHLVNDDKSIPLYKLEMDHNMHDYLKEKRIEDILFIKEALSDNHR